MIETETLVELITKYVEEGNYEEAEKLAIIGEYLDNCFYWELDLYPEQQEEGDYA